MGCSFLGYLLLVVIHFVLVTQQETPAVENDMSVELNGYIGGDKTHSGELVTDPNTDSQDTEQVNEDDQYISDMNLNDNESGDDLDDEAELDDEDLEQLRPVMEDWLMHWLSHKFVAASPQVQHAVLSALSDQVSKYMEGSGLEEVEKRHLSSVMSGWLQDVSSADRDKMHFGAGMSDWLNEVNDISNKDKKSIGSAMSDWLQEWNHDRQKKHLGSAISGRFHHMKLQKKHLGSANSAWLQGKNLQKKHLGSVNTAWLQEMNRQKKHLGSANSAWLQDMNLQKKHIGSANSAWLHRNGPQKKHLGSAMSDWLQEIDERDKKHIGSANSAWLHSMNSNRAKKHIGSVSSNWLKEHKLRVRRDVQPQGNTKKKKVPTATLR